MIRASFRVSIRGRVARLCAQTVHQTEEADVPIGPNGCIDVFLINNASLVGAAALGGPPARTHFSYFSSSSRFSQWPKK